MKISHEQKKENRKKILAAAVDLMIEKGFKSTTMREIARKAGIGDATIYNYFPTKESILYAYYEDKVHGCADKLNQIEGFDSYHLQEKLQAFFEGMLELFLPDREFIQESFKSIFFALSPDYRRLKPVRHHFFQIVKEFFDAAEDDDEIPEQIFREMIFQLFWDYFIGVVFYWLNDGSDQFSDTSILIDKTLDLACAFLRTGLNNKIFDVASFLFKRHILSRMDFFKENVETIQRLKKEIMDDCVGKKNTNE